MKNKMNIRVHSMVLLFAMSLPVDRAFAHEPEKDFDDTLDLFECHRSAMETHPIQAQKEMYLQTRDLKQKNQDVNWFPSLDLNGSYTWQNEVVQIPFAEFIPGFEKPAMPHYNYKLTLDVKQTLYDGGMSRKGKLLEDASYEVNRQQIEVSLNQLKSQVNRLYFYILVLQQQERTLKLKLGELSERLGTLESHLRNETILASDLDLLRAENLNAEQQLSEIRLSRKAALDALGELTDLPITPKTLLLLPEREVDLNDESELPEIALFDLQIKSLDATINLTERKRFPKAYVFGQLGYGNPALNFFRDEFRGYYIVGAGLHWNIWDWSRTSREKQILAVRQDIIRTQKESFDKNLDIQLEEQLASIRKFEEAMERDREIVELRQNIRRSASSQLENGLITSSDYIGHLNAEIQARIQLDLHRVQLEQARINYLTNKGAI